MNKITCPTEVGVALRGHQLWSDVVTLVRRPTRHSLLQGSLSLIGCCCWSRGGGGVQGDWRKRRKTSAKHQSTASICSRRPPHYTCTSHAVHPPQNGQHVTAPSATHHTTVPLFHCLRHTSTAAHTLWRQQYFLQLAFSLSTAHSSSLASGLILLRICTLVKK